MDSITGSPVKKNTDENPDGFIPKDNIVSIIQSSKPVRSSYYSPLREDDDGQVVEESQIILNPSGMKEMEGFSLNGLFEYYTTVSQELKQKFTQLASLFKSDRGYDAKFLFIPYDDPLKQFEFELFFEQDFIDWIKEKISADSLFLSRNFYSPKDTLFSNLLRSQLQTSSKEKSNQQTWVQIGPYSPDSLRNLADQYKTRVATYFNAQGSEMELADRVKVHEMSHYIHSESLFLGAYKDIVATYCGPLVSEIDQNDQYSENETIRASVQSLKKQYAELLGLAESYAMLFELYNSTIIQNGTHASEDAFAARLAIILSHVKKFPGSLHSTFEDELNGMAITNSNEVMEAHDLGTLILLTKGKVLSKSITQIYDVGTGNDLLTQEKVIAMIDGYEKDSNAFFKDFDPIQMKDTIEAKLHDNLELLLETLKKLAPLLQSTDTLPERLAPVVEKMKNGQLDKINEKLRA